MAGVETPLPGLGGEEENFIEEFEVADGDIPELDGMPQEMPETQKCVGVV